jgi:serine/threonine-protein kinase
LAERYTLERELGHGGMATVYLARDPRHRRMVALKVLGPNSLQASAQLASFMK